MVGASVVVVVGGDGGGGGCVLMIQTKQFVSRLIAGQRRIGSRAFTCEFPR